MAVLLMATGLGIVVVLILSQGQINQKFEENLGEVDLVVGAKGSPLQLVLSSVYHIDNPTGNVHQSRLFSLDRRPFIDAPPKPPMMPEHNPYIDYSIPISLGDNYKGDRIVGTIPKYIEMYGGELAEGRMWNKPMEIVIGANVYEKHKDKLKLGKLITGGHGIGGELLEEHDHAHDDSPYEIVGILKRTGKVIDNLLMCEYRSSWIVHAGHGNETTFELKSELEQPETDSTGIADSTKIQGDSVIDMDMDTVESLDVHTHDEHNHDEHGHDDHGHDDHAHHDHGHHHGHHHELKPVNTDSILALIPDDKKEVTAMLIKYKSKRGQMFLPLQINKNSSLLAADPDIQRDSVLKLVDSAIQTANLMGVFVLIMSAISVFISLYSSLKDRGYEIAITRVLGAKKGQVFLMIVLEGIILSVLGYILALVLAHIGMWIVAGILESNYHYTFEAWNFSIFELYLLGVALIIGLISAFIPAVKAYRTDISKTLSK